LEFINCFQTPKFTALGRTDACKFLHKPTKSYYKFPTDAFRKVDRIRVDATRCQPGLNKIGIPAELLPKGKELLKPFEVKLRPMSTDHDVFLQVRPLHKNFVVLSLAVHVASCKPLRFLVIGCAYAQGGVCWNA
jgi:hypothetical protein